MSDRVIGSDNPFTVEERAVLEIVVGTMIPASEEYGVPGADDATIFANILSKYPPAKPGALCVSRSKRLLRNRMRFLGTPPRGRCFTTSTSIAQSDDLLVPDVGCNL